MPDARRSFPAARRPVAARDALRRACLDALEPRRLLASNLAAGVLTVDGTAGDDDVRLNLSAGQIVVTLNGAQDGAFDASAVGAIRVFGADGNDAVSIGSGITGARLDGGNGNDTLAGGDGNDDLFGRAGDDQLQGNGGNDVLSGGLGSDALDGGAGTADTADYSDRTENLTVTMDGGSNDGAAGGAEGDDVRPNVENFLGGVGNDSVKGNDSNNDMRGGAGDDTLIGNAGNDTLDGNDGNDTVDGKEGSDVLIGGAGFDAADYRFETADLTLSIDGVANEAGGNAAGDNITTSIERVVGGAGNDRITGSDADNSLDGRAGNDTILGGLGNDSLDGSDGNDNLAGESGNDVLTGDPGNDTMTGGAGDDAFVANDGQPDTLDGGSGNDNAVADQPGDSFTSIESGINIPAPEIAVSVGGGDLTDNFSTVDFGTVGQGAAGPTRTFTVRNDGDDVLSLGAVSVPTGFTLIDPLVGPLAPGASESFTVRLDTAVAGTVTGDVSFANSDSDENPFNFAVTATITAAPPQIPDIAVSLGQTGIPDGQSAPINFGAVDRNGAAPTRTFTVFNTGDGPLTVGGVSVPAGFTLIDPLVGPIAAGGAESFTVRMDTATAGAKGGQVVITTNDPDEDPYNFAIAGTVSAPPPPTQPDITVTLRAPAGPIDNGNSTVEFGNRLAGSRGSTRTFRVRNDGDATLDLGTISVPAGFKLIDPLVGPLAPGEAESFVVQLDTATPGTKNGFVSIDTNDPDEDPFTFRVVGNIGVEDVPLPEITLNALQRGQLRGVVDGVSSFSLGAAGADTRFSRAARTFRLANDGNATLALGTLSVPRGFVVLDGIPDHLDAGETDTLVIAIDTTSGVGGKSGQFSFATNDANENPFSFGVSASVTALAPGAAPEVSVVTTSGQTISDGLATPISFGSARKDAKNPTRTFRIRNEGTAPLTVGRPSLPAGFVLVEAPAGTVAPGSATSFTIGLDTRTATTRSGQVQFSTNDSNENPFNFAISGVVTAPATPPPTSSSVTASLSSGGTLTVNGTSTIDTISFALSSRGLTVVGNGASVGGSPFNGVKRITVNGVDGDDRLDASSLSLPVTLNGGNGNDTLIGGGGDDVLSGGSGDDNLLGNGGIDVLRGDDGADTLTATDGVADSVVDGGSGNDTIRKDRVDPSNGT
jgi:Ca2+-binding RTX toxin-like protein